MNVPLRIFLAAKTPNKDPVEKMRRPNPSFHTRTPSFILGLDNLDMTFSTKLNDLFFKSVHKPKFPFIEITITYPIRAIFRTSAGVVAFENGKSFHLIMKPTFVIIDEALMILAQRLKDFALPLRARAGPR